MGSGAERTPVLVGLIAEEQVGTKHYVLLDLGDEDPKTGARWEAIVYDWETRTNAWAEFRYWSEVRDWWRERTGKTLSLLDCAGMRG